MKLPPFRLYRPHTVEEASRLLTALGDDAAAYCGGTELLLAMKLGLTTYEHLVDLKRVDGLRGVTPGSGGVLRIGAATTHHEIETSAAVRASYPEMAMMISQVANVRVRSVGTIGGNLCFADPHSDPASFLMAVGATLESQLDGQVRRIPAAGFLTGLYETILAPGELLTAIELPARPDHTGLIHRRMKLTERPAVTVTAQLTLHGNAVAQARLIVGSVGIEPLAVDATALLGATATDFAARSAACAVQAAADCAPLPGGEASPDYLRHLVAVYAREALGDAFASAAAAEASPVEHRRVAGRPVASSG
jgi:aerobic carbon-monoxide dehydrogenase medium subunit